MRLPRVNVFALIVIGYVLIQVYAMWRAYTGLALAPYTIPIFALWVGLMTFALPILWAVERRGWHFIAEVVAWIGFGWMGFVFLFFWIALGLDVLGLLVSAVAASPYTEPGAYSNVLRSFPFAFAVTLAVTVYGFVDARRIRIERVRIASPKLSADHGPFRAAVISDVHLGVVIGARRLRRIIEQLRRLDADVVISLGDLVDGQADRLSPFAPLLAGLRPRYGKFAVTGNHEYYVGLAHALNFHRHAGFAVLRANAVDVTEKISIAGVDDQTGPPVHRDEYGPLSGVARDRFKILLKHRPDIDPRAAEMFDLQLSGHVHKGQIFPFVFLVRLMYPIRTGLTRLAQGSWLYISRGTGTWGPPIRVGAPPEITLIELEPAAS